jgi:hypothetical protein
LRILHLTLTALLFLANTTHAQDTSRLDKIIALPDKLFSSLDKKTASIQTKLQKQTDKYLTKLQRHEENLKKKLWSKDSVKAEEVFGDIDKRYADLRKTSGNLSKYASVYSGHLDSLSTALHFINGQNGSKNLEIQKLLSQYSGLQQKLNATEQIRKQLQHRQQQLKQQFENLGMIKELKQFRKQVYYFQAQVKEYKQLFEDPSKLEAKLMELVMKIPQFKDFFAKNSMLGSLFALPGNGNNLTASLQGLQTRAMVNQSIIDRFGTGPNVTQQLQQNVQSAQSQLNELKNKVNGLSNGSFGNGDADVPNFKPNSQKTKSFLQRLEYGTNIQSQKARYFFPVTSDIGLSLGYRLNDKSIIGIGASYKVGWGHNWNNIKLTHQGIGLRSYLDWKIKGQVYISGGYEQNYRNMINSVDQLRDYSAWQSSGLIGVSKRYKAGKKLNGEMKLMWDFLSYQQVPKGQPIIFRVGYSLK